jgi:D-arginine dehydrogenase
MNTATADVVVIGAGIAGASVAGELAQTHKVIVLEREDFPGMHSTGGSAPRFFEI